jgi:hypothetical protein
MGFFNGTDDFKQLLLSTTASTLALYALNTCSPIGGAETIPGAREDQPAWCAGSDDRFLGTRDNPDDIGVHIRVVRLARLLGLLRLPLGTALLFGLAFLPLGELALPFRLPRWSRSSHEPLSIP